MDKKYLRNPMIKYRRFVITDKWSCNENFDMLLIFIGQYNNIYKDKDNLIANAYIAIRRKTDALLNVKSKHNPLRTTKAEIKSIRRSFNKYFSDKRTLIKIPYKVIFIFQAIYEIVQDITKHYSLPNNLIEFVDKTYRDIFYNKHYETYMVWYNSEGHSHRDDMDYIRDIELKNDFDAPDSPFVKKFPAGGEGEKC